MPLWRTRMASDLLDKETSVSVTLTDQGIKGSAKSRTIAALDRLCGNALDFLNIPVERRNEIRRAEIAGEKRAIETAIDSAIDRMKVDPKWADRALENHLSNIFRAQSNKDAVAGEAVEQ